MLKVALILIGLYFISQGGTGGTGTGGNEQESGNLDTDLNDALDETGNLDSELGLDEDFDFSVE
ncbi:hypothetical protein COU62_01190 [Candidatus Pacearchaeota archaeon CG10_big_fil_rev_8_21_14_0_10_35_219]|nr:hypothetical protein [Candidatus Pacearchaeota archaeon]OIO43053.1 MAG: hypothetical protein AUJ63_01360 [Candidatus Pacearchaeota archaeon CG1_02_35_32]PIO08179.1 MAG: hypothetical protein COU62_01190 [Candidatus Pacearchaeota archaeon CG10_big_fil_rev_8_21_14_0_10_35_219]PIY81111.1 MAG: hypothetical protein COY79_04900 [Candidatus Pacearchaeota archaeon CG_4_10_14_0_8_um_filter_35_169]PIZ79760.1 MAG: hypothetical protein COY00_03435 [Candidatus Pacearchaeota archaeon CG_4_10_14_0_2_um_filt